MTSYEICMALSGVAGWIGLNIAAAIFFARRCPLNVA